MKAYKLFIERDLMKSLMKKSIIAMTIFLMLCNGSFAVTNDELLQIHKVTDLEMYSISAPQKGSLVYNTTYSTIYFYTGVDWKRLRSLGSETIVSGGSGISIVGQGTESAPYVIGK